jgi:hypothetical protein
VHAAGDHDRRQYMYAYQSYGCQKDRCGGMDAAREGVLQLDGIVGQCVPFGWVGGAVWGLGCGCCCVVCAELQTTLQDYMQL